MHLLCSGPGSKQASGCAGCCWRVIIILGLDFLNIQESPYWKNPHSDAILLIEVNRLAKQLEFKTMAKKVNRSSPLQAVNLVNLVLHLFCLEVFIKLKSNGVLIEGPQNTAADYGQTVTLICRTGERDDAKWLAMLENSDKEIYNGARIIFMHSVFKVNDTGPGQFDLQFNASTKEVATQFICLESYTRDSRVAEVTVLESPTCSGNATSYTCSVKFAGNWAPQIYWVYKDGNSAQESKASQNHDGHLLAGTLIVSELSDAPPICRIRFARDNYNGSATATNIPDYNKEVNCTLSEGADDLPNGTTSRPDPGPCGSGCVAGIICGLLICICVIALVLWIKKRFPFESRQTQKNAQDILVPMNGGTPKC